MDKKKQKTKKTFELLDKTTINSAILIYQKLSREWIAGGSPIMCDRMKQEQLLIDVTQNPIYGYDE